MPIKPGNCCIRWTKLQKVRVRVLYPASNIRTSADNRCGLHTRAQVCGYADQLIPELFFDEIDNRGSERQSFLSFILIERLIRQASRDPIWIAGRDIIEIKSPWPARWYQKHC